MSVRHRGRPRGKVVWHTHGHGERNRPRPLRTRAPSVFSRQAEARSSTSATFLGTGGPRSSRRGSGRRPTSGGRRARDLFSMEGWNGKASRRPRPEAVASW